MSKGTVPITGTITTTNELDTYPTHWDKYAKGGFRTVTDTTARDAITIERRTDGMQVFVRDIKQLHQLVGGIDNTKWVTILTIDNNNKIIVNNDVSSQKYIIEGDSVASLPNAIALSSKPDGYLVNNLGKVTTTDFIIPTGISLTMGKVLIGGPSNKAVESQTLKIQNLPGDLTASGLIKLDITTSELKIAVPDVDYATKDQLVKIAAAAQSSADAASHDAGLALASAGEASGAALLAKGYKDLADGYATSAGESMTAAAGSAGLALGFMNNASDFADDASDYADTSKAASHVAGERRDEAADSATNAANSLHTLQTTGLNALPNSGNINFQNFKGINVADGTDPGDLVNFGQLSSYIGGTVNSVTGTAGEIVATGTTDVVLSLADTTVTSGTYAMMNATVNKKGQITSASSNALAGTANRIQVNLASGTYNFNIATNYVGQTSITTLGTITTGTWNGSLIPLAFGGTNANLTASNGGILYSTASSLAILSGTASSNQLMISGANSTPSWTSRYIDYGTSNPGKLGNLFAGQNCGSPSIVSGLKNTGFGINSLSTINAGANENTGFGYATLNYVTTGFSNTAIGSSAGAYAYTSSQCTFLGAVTSNYNGVYIINSTAVGYGVELTNSNTVILGNNCSVGIGTNAPTAQLSVGAAGAVPTGGAVFNNYSSTGAIARITLTGREYVDDGNTSNEGIAIYLALNRNNFRAIAFSDTTYAKNTTNSMLRISFQNNVTAIESTDTSQSAYKRLNINALTIFSNTSSVYTPAGGAWLASSDKRVKKNIKQYNRGLKEILSLNPVIFQFNEDSDFSDEIQDKENVGFIADEVEQVMPECVGSIPNAKYGETKSLNITSMTHALINAIKELNTKIEYLENKINNINN